MTIESRFDIPFIANIALREKQIQQNYRPVIAVHKWFARRPGSLFRGLLLSEFVDRPLQESYYQSHNLAGIKIIDPFMGGGTPVLEANRVGCDIVGVDINPMAHWIVTEEISTLDLTLYNKATQKLGNWLRSKVGDLYLTRCLHCNSPSAQVKYFLWVKQLCCKNCNNDFDLFPGYQIAQDRRHTHNVLVCCCCGHLNEVVNIAHPGNCIRCQEHLTIEGPARKNRCSCAHCGVVNEYPCAKDGPPRHRMFAIEYVCSDCRGRHAGRFFKRPDAEDLSKFGAAVAAWNSSPRAFTPTDRIPEGDETNRLHRWGYSQYSQLFNERQLLGLDIICSGITKHLNERIRHALATNLSDLLRYQNMLCRYDIMALKSLDIFSVHGFPVGLIQCESNILGVANSNGPVVGSGGWINITEKYRKAKHYCQNPFEIAHQGGRKTIVPMIGEWIGETALTDSTTNRKVSLLCTSSTNVELPESSIDAILTDPPYFGNVQYAELMDFCYVWLRRLIGEVHPPFREHSTRRKDELTGNATMERDLAHFAAGLSEAFSRVAKALKPGGPLVFTYHHNRVEAYWPVAIALLDANLICTKALPCPAEMGGSIHISGSSSSILDTVFVCRAVEAIPDNASVSPADLVTTSVKADIDDLGKAGIRIRRGDIRCLLFGHATRLVVSWLKSSWNLDLNTKAKLNIIETVMFKFGSMEEIVQQIQITEAESGQKRTS